MCQKLQIQKPKEGKQQRLSLHSQREESEPPQSQDREVRLKSSFQLLQLGTSAIEIQSNASNYEFKLILSQLFHC